jgi:hypothetical protein
MQSQLLFLRLLSQENAHFSLSASRGVLHMHALHVCVCVSSRAAAVATHELHLFCCA